jgi:Tfp pilus assembly protein PilF
MKFYNVTLLLILSIITSCATQKRDKVVSNKNHDFFSEESFLRFDKNRLKENANNAPCFAGNIIDDLKELRSSLDQNKDNPHYWNQIATCYYLNEQYTKAEYYYQVSLNTAQKKGQVYSPALNNLGLLNLSLKHYITARDYFRKALKNNQFVTPRYNLALIHLKYNKPEMAIKLLSRFAKNKSSDPDLNFNLAYAHYLLGQTQMTHHFLSLMGEQQERSDVIYLKAIMLYDQQKYEQAISLIETSKISIKEFNKTNNTLKILAEKQIERLEELAELEEERKEKIVKKTPKVTKN